MPDELAMIDPPEIDSPVVETPEQDHPEVDLVPKEQPEVKVEDKTDGRKVADSLRKRIAELKKQADAPGLDPNLAAALRNDAALLQNKIGREGAYSQLWPKVEEARSAATLFKSVGGADGIARLQQVSEQSEAESEMIRNGDAKVLDGLFEQAGENIAKLAPTFLDKLAQNPKLYESVVTPHALGYMENVGLVGSLDSLIQAFNAKDERAQKDILSRISSWYNQAKQGVDSKRTAQPDPERQKFEQERKEFQQQKVKAETDRVWNETAKYATGKIDESLKTYQARLKLAPEPLDALRQDIYREVIRERNADQTFKTGARLHLQGEMPKPTFLDYVNQDLDARLKVATEKVVTLRYGAFLKSNTKPNPTQQKANPTAQPVKSQPAAPKTGDRFQDIINKKIPQMRQGARV